MARVNPPRINCKVKIARFGRTSIGGWATVTVAVVWLHSLGVALGQTTRTDYLDADPGLGIETLGRLHEALTQGFRTPARQVVEGPSASVIPVEVLIDQTTHVYSTQSLQPASNAANTSGSGLNINNDGTCIVGYQDAGFFTPFHAFRWTQATKAVDLGTLNPQNNSTFSSFATDTNQDCSVVVGISNQTSTFVEHAFRWTQSGGMVDLGVPTNGGPNSRAFGVSSTGTVVVGDADFPAGAFIRKGAFRWTGGSFTDLIPGLNQSLATAVSADGTVVVGQVRTSTGSSAFRWTTQNPTAQLIGPLPGHATAAATGVSDNGKIVVGMSQSTFLLQYRGVVLGWDPGIAFRWTQAKGIQDLRQILVDGGVNMDNITLVSVTGMSRDGQWIQGAATTPQTGPGETVAYVAHVCDDDIGGPCSTTGAAPFTLGAAPNQVTVPAGQSGTTTITVTPNAGFTQPVSFSCGGLPVGAACSFNPATVTPPGTVSTTLTITTNGGPVALLPSASPTMFASLFLPIALIPVGLLMRRRGSDGRLRSVAAACVISLAVVGMLSCSSSDSTPPPATNSGGVPATGTPAGISTVTVTATSGAGSTGVPVTLTVTRP